MLCTVLIGAGGVLLAALLYNFVKTTFVLPKRHADEALPEGDPKAQLTIFGARPRFHVSLSPSPGVGKVVMLAKLANLDHKLKECNPSEGPKGKMPWIVHGANTVADSHWIIEYLLATYPSIPNFTPAAQLDAASSALQTAVQRICEDSLYFCMVDYYWLTEQGWPLVLDAYFGKVPAPVRAIIGPMVRKQIFTSLHGQGTARHSRQEVYQILQENIDSLSGLLGNNPYFGGRQLSSGDLSAFCHLDCLLNGVPVTGPKEYVETKQNLVDYVERVKAHFH